MSFAQNFKQKLNNTDLFEPLENNDKPDVDVKIKPSGNAIPSISPEQVNYKFNDLVSDVIKKIKKTPYWKEYSDDEQEKMISKYFDAKVKQSRYSQIKFNLKDKIDFIENVFNRVKRF